MRAVSTWPIGRLPVTGLPVRGRAVRRLRVRVLPVLVRLVGRLPVLALAVLTLLIWRLALTGRRPVLPRIGLRCLRIPGQARILLGATFLRGDGVLLGRGLPRRRTVLGRRGRVRLVRIPRWRPAVSRLHQRCHQISVTPASIVRLVLCVADSIPHPHGRVPGQRGGAGGCGSGGGHSGGPGCCGHCCGGCCDGGH